MSIEHWRKAAGLRAFLRTCCVESL